MGDLQAKTPKWFWIIGIIFLLWNIMGVVSFFAHTFMTEEAISALPENEGALYQQYPFWVYVAFAIAVFFGLFGAIALLLKKKTAKLAFIISLCGIIPQMIHNMFFTSSIEVYGLVQATIMPLLVVVFGVFLIWFSNHAIKKHWIN